MRLFENLFHRRYLEWDEYSVLIDDIDDKTFKRKIKENNEKVRKEMFKNTNFSG